MVDLIGLSRREGILRLRGRVGGRNGPMCVRGSTATQKYPAMNESVYCDGDPGGIDSPQLSKDDSQSIPLTNARALVDFKYSGNEWRDKNLLLIRCYQTEREQVKSAKESIPVTERRQRCRVYIDWKL